MKKKKKIKVKKKAATKCFIKFCLYFQKGQASHFQRFIESEKGLNEAWKGRKELQRLQREMEAVLISRYKDEPGNVELAR